MSYDPYKRRSSDVFNRSSIGVPVDAGLRAYMQRVYSYMAGGLVLTGLVAYLSASSGLHQSIAATPLTWVIMLAPLGFVLALNFGIERMRVGTAAFLFCLFAAVMEGGVANPHGPRRPDRAR
jgi:FtsH-binding integral membrane protein